MRAFVLLAVAALAAGLPDPVPDAPYVEVIPTRMTLKGQPGVDGWSSTPFASPALQLLSLQGAAQPAVAAVLADGSVWRGRLPAAPRSASSPGMLTNNATLWNLPVEWQQLQGLSVPDPAASKAAVVSVAAGQAVFAVVSKAGVQLVTCVDAQCKAGAVSSMALGAVHDVACASKTLWIGCDGGMYAFEVASSTWVRLLDSASPNTGAVTTVAASAAVGLAAGGNPNRLWLFDVTHPSDGVVWWEWVTQVSTGAGGPIADNITALAFHDATSTLYIGSPSALNIMYANRTVNRVDGPGGLPYANITGLALQHTDVAGADRHLLHVATDAGLATADVTPTAAARATGGAQDVVPTHPSNWRYKYLSRWLPGPRVTAVVTPTTGVTPYAIVATAPDPSGLAPASPLSGYGIGVLEEQAWKLELKAQRLGAIQSRHNRHGLVAECSLSAYGDASTCSNHPSDNNGLWTSLVVVSEALRYNVTGAADAAESAWTYYRGMRLLHDVTDIPGLIGRSAIDPNETHAAGGLWTPSKAPAYPGWTWKADASSDEVAGHMFGLSAAANWLHGAPAQHPGGGNASEAAEYLLTMTDYIVKNNFLMIDFDGSPTRWAHFGPDDLNHNRSWSDERGVNAVEMLSMLVTSVGANSRLSNPDAARVTRLTDAWATLTNSTNGYLNNLVNLKIETPVDDNYSDDELTYLPYFGWLVAALDPHAAPFVAGASSVLASVSRTFGVVATERPDLWNAMTLAMARRWPAAAAIVSDTTVTDMVENLRNWPLEGVEWNVRNSHRLDVVFAPGINREGASHTAARRVLPANERAQGRWNSNPRDLDGGSGGMSEMDQGAWLLPFWVARFSQFVQ